MFWWFYNFLCLNIILDIEISLNSFLHNTVLKLSVKVRVRLSQSLDNDSDSAPY